MCDGAARCGGDGRAQSADQPPEGGTGDRRGGRRGSRDLASRDEIGERLRTTLRVLFAHGHNRSEAADALNVHYKTVSYRITQAEQLLGRTITKNTADLEAALLVDLTLHGP